MFSNKRIYFLILLKRARVPSNDILNFYCTCVRPVLEYCAPVFHRSLPAYLCNDIERVQRRALSVIEPASSYHETLSRFNLCTLKERRSGLCEKVFTSIKLDKEHKLHHFLPEKNLSTYSLRKPRPFKNFKARTNRFKANAYYCYCAYVLRILRYSDFLSVMLTNTGILLRHLKLPGESRS